MGNRSLVCGVVEDVLWDVQVFFGRWGDDRDLASDLFG